LSVSVALTGTGAGVGRGVARVFKPGIAMGVTFSALAGQFLGSGGSPHLTVTSAMLGAVLLSAMGAGGLNCAIDTEIDSLMPRARSRARAVEAIGRGRLAAVSLAMFASACALSQFYLNTLTTALIILAGVMYIGLYTVYFKRRSPFGTVPGGIPGALPVLIGYASAGNGIGFDGLILFSLMLMWQPVHFLALSLKYADDYRAAGVPVMPVALGEKYTKAFMFAYACTLPLISLSLYVFGYASFGFAGLGVALGIIYMAATYIDVVKTTRYGRAFGTSIVYIMLLMTGLILDAILMG